MQFGTATICFMTKNCCTVREMWQSVCVLWVIGMLHSIAGLIGRMAFLQTFRNTQWIPQLTVFATGTITHKLLQNRLLSIFVLPIQIFDGSYLEIATGPDSVWSDTPLVEPVCKGNAVYERLSTCLSTTYGHHINCAVRAVQHREHSVWYSKQVWLSEQHIGESGVRGNWG
jgi:hypothetical protein